MGKGVRMAVLVVVAAVLGLVKTSNAATYVVGDTLGWLVPPGGAIAYSTWAADKTFVVGDVLVFNFTSGRHDVAEVTKTAFDNCNATSPISLSTETPTNITLTTAGEHFFICTFDSHCTLGQKLDINVTAASSPAPEAAPAPAAARNPVNYVVGDALGWLVPPGGAVAYSTWANDKTFFVGDTLVFNFTEGRHDVAEVTKTAFDDCNATSPISLFTATPTNITLTTAGEHFFICTFDGHCSLGQKLAINVTATTTTTPSSPSAPTQAPTSATTPSSSPSAPTQVPTSAPTPTSPTASTPSGSAPSPSSSSSPQPPPSTTTPTTPSPSDGSTPPPPPPSSAPSFAAAGFTFTILSVTVALLY